MNDAMFIDSLWKYNEDKNEFMDQMEKIRCAQKEICDAERTIELRVGTIKIVKDKETYKPVLTADKKVLEECCEKISENINLIKEAYNQLIKMGIFEEKSQ